MKLADKSFMVTGGASGLGWAVTQHFLKQGARVWVLDLPNDQYAKKVAELGE